MYVTQKEQNQEVVQADNQWSGQRELGEVPSRLCLCLPTQTEERFIAFPGAGYCHLPPRAPRGIHSPSVNDHCNSSLLPTNICL
jgi:hypothetical protein